jgi:hypothetical protein
MRYACIKKDSDRVENVSEAGLSEEIETLLDHLFLPYLFIRTLLTHGSQGDGVADKHP